MFATCLDLQGIKQDPNGNEFLNVRPRIAALVPEKIVPYNKYTRRDISLRTEHTTFRNSKFVENKFIRSLTFYAKKE